MIFPSVELVAFIAILFLGIFTQSLSGFGSALVAMAVLPGLLGLHVAAPLVALVAATAEFILLLRFRGALTLQPIWRMALGAVLGIPLGVLALRQVNEKITLTLLGSVLILYALYALFQFRLPVLAQPRWAFAFGFAAGLLGGAYNTSGPPAVVYADSSRWSPAEFKANLQAFFLLSDVLVVTAHGVTGNLTGQVWQLYLLAVPVIGIAIWAGRYCERFINPVMFRNLVLCLLIGLGIRMLF